MEREGSYTDAKGRLRWHCNDALAEKLKELYDFLVIGHESFGIVEEVGPNVRGIEVGDYVTATVRRPGGSIYDQIGRTT